MYYSYIGRERLFKPQKEIEEILNQLVIGLQEKYALQAHIKVVGSVKRNLVTVDECGKFDLDYNLCFTEIPPSIRGKWQRFKDIVRTMLDDITDSYGYSYGQNSTSVITVCKLDDDYSLDLGILIQNRNGQYCRLIRQKKSNNYHLQEVPLLYYTEEYENYIYRYPWGNTMVRNMYIDYKNEFYGEDSFHVYLKTLNAVYQKLGGKRMAKISGNSHTKNQMNHYSNQHNPNNCASKATIDNRANQLNPNNIEFMRNIKSK